LIRNAELAQNLLNDGIRLPPDTLPTAVKPLAGLPDAEGLRSVCWQFAAKLSPARVPSSTAISRIVRLVRHELDDTAAELDSEPCSSGGSHYGPRKRRLKDPPSRERPFLAPVIRLAAFPSFSAAMVVASVGSPDQAVTTYRICSELIDRLHAVQDCLKTSFPNV
jgi:hypothetical protein